VRRRAAWLIALAWLGLPTPAAAETNAARELVHRALAAIPRVPFVATMQLSVERGAPRILQLQHKVVGGNRASYLEVREPLDVRGMRFLFLEGPDGQAQQFFKIAAARRVIQVADELRRQAFLGSTFYVADLIEPSLDAFTYTFVGDDELLKRSCRLVESVPKQRAGALYAKVIVAVDPRDFLILKRLFLDDNGTVLKAWTVERVEKVNGYWTLLDQRMRNLTDQSESRLEITEIRHNVAIPDETFTPEYLAR
jgi:hypothetical protein